MIPENNIEENQAVSREPLPLGGASCCASFPRRYKWRVGGTIDIYDTGDIYPDRQGSWVKWDDVQEMYEQNRHLKDQLATLSKTHAKDMTRLSDMIDKRQEALRYISEIIEEKAAEREDLELGSTAYKSVRRLASLFLHNAKVEARRK